MRRSQTMVLGVATWALFLTQVGCVEPAGSGANEITGESLEVTPLPPPPETSEPSPIPPPETSEPSPIPPPETSEPSPVLPGTSEKIYQVGGDVVAPRRISGKDPDYDALAQAHRIRGVTIFRFVVTEEGRVEDVEFLNLGAPELAEPIEEAVKTWRFEPATLHGEPVAVHYAMTIHIRLQ